MKSNFEVSLEAVLTHEGFWANHPKDPGGATMQGVTLKTYSEWLGRPASKEELRKIPGEHLKTIYKTRYWDAVRADELPAGVDYVVFDMAVNSGPGRAAKILQRCVGAIPDGAIGPKTMALVNGIPEKDIILKFSDGRKDFYKSLGTFDTFGEGWLRRAKECEDKALTMIGDK